ncbi:hypothetical protein VCR12J2_640282 [Vibrio coralliirubri]|nr:hypothetical protein VCR12J2_640282 [Vibrio coralliirubri]
MNEFGLFRFALYNNCTHIKTKPLVSTNRTLTRHVCKTGQLIGMNYIKESVWNSQN